MKPLTHEGSKTILRATFMSAHIPVYILQHQLQQTRRTHAEIIIAELFHHVTYWIHEEFRMIIMVEENVLLYNTHTMEKEYEGYITTELERYTKTKSKLRL
jgi:hypothetical protein